MTRFLTTFAVLAVAAIGAWYLWGSATVVAGDAPKAAPPVQRPSPTADFACVGVGSCSASACHGGSLAEKPAWRSSYTVWAIRDKHAHAYDVLSCQQAKEMVRILKRLPADAKVDPTRENRCTGCHTVGSASAQSAGMLADGVGCEACHGPAANWLVDHTTTLWKGAHPREKYNARTGMVNTENLLDRARVCVDCHVGAPPELRAGSTITRDVNHDLLAAGHPRLNFEFSAYMANLPAHWDTTDDEALGWASGQIVSAQAAVNLLASRAHGAEKHTAEGIVWPEFAEYECFACHHGLQSTSDRRPVAHDGGADAQRRLGTYPWATWNSPMVELLADMSSSRRSALAALTRHMSAPYPDPKVARESAQSVSLELEELLKKFGAPGLGPGWLDDALRKMSQAPVSARWDHEAQRYLALVALVNASAARHERAAPRAPAGQPRFEEIRAALLEYRRVLQFGGPCGESTAKRGSAGVTRDSPASFKRPEAEAAVLKIRKLVDQLLGPPSASPKN